MSLNSDSLKTAKRRDLEFFFGDDLHMTSGSYFQFRRIIDADNILVLTNNIKKIKDNYVLVTAPDKGVYLKDWQIRKVSSYKAGINCYVVKLSRKFFKPYKFSFEFEDLLITDEDTFDTLYNVANEQEKENIAMREGWCN